MRISVRKRASVLPHGAPQTQDSVPARGRRWHSGARLAVKRRCLGERGAARPTTAVQRGPGCEPRRCLGSSKSPAIRRRTARLKFAATPTRVAPAGTANRDGGACDGRCREDKAPRGRCQQRLPDGELKFVKSKRFDEAAARPEALPGRQVQVGRRLIPTRPSAHRNDGSANAAAAQIANHSMAVSFGHEQVANHHVGRFGDKRRQSGQSVGCFADPMPLGFQNPRTRVRIPMSSSMTRMVAIREYRPQTGRRGTGLRATGSPGVWHPRIRPVPAAKGSSPWLAAQPGRGAGTTPPGANDRARLRSARRPGGPRSRQGTRKDRRPGRAVPAAAGHNFCARLLTTPPGAARG